MSANRLHRTDENMGNADKCVSLTGSENIIKRPPKGPFLLYARISFRMKLIYASAKPITTSMIMATRCGQICSSDCPRLR